MNEVVITSDQSSSVYSSKFDALYHSKHGAIQESKHVFLASGLDEFIDRTGKASVDILEIGFGTGLNALLTLIHSQSKDLSVQYSALEAYPISLEILEGLNYTSILGYKKAMDQMHSTPWNMPIEISTHFKLHKIKTLFEEFRSEETFDVIYFDAFAPNTQEELWNLDMMKKMYSLSHNGSILVTYCAKGVVRRTMQEAGFEVFRIPGPPGKREMLRAIRTS
jgi:tRNA U34 5-methylaminomethyl-2-thiouridine-forming methyltransferase MnmC